MLEKISFTNYKLFKRIQTLEIKPITILIGKNSSGKSAIAKLLTLISASLSGQFSEILRLNNDGVELGSEFSDLIYGKNKLSHLTLNLKNKTDEAELVIGNQSYSGIRPVILSYTLNGQDITNQAFRGFVPQGNFSFPLKLDTEYIGPFRKIPERWYAQPQALGANDKVGIEGEHAYKMLIADAITTQKRLIHEVSDVYRNYFEGWGLQVNQNNAPPYQIELFQNGVNINIKDVGQGMSQALPLVVRALQPISNTRLIIVEQPELHLHPAAHGNLAQLFVESTQKDPNKHYLIETHAQNFVLRVRRLIAEGRLDPQNVALYFVDFDENTRESNLKQIQIDNLGRVDYWPRNVFSETLDETIAIRDAQLSISNPNNP